MKLLTSLFTSSARAASIAALAISTLFSQPVFAQEPFIGEIRFFGGNFAPRGWALCDGQLLAISQNSALFSILGTTYGGDGRTTFALPDMRGRGPLHPGNGSGLSSFRLGQRGGRETVTLNQNQLPSHTHSGSSSLLVSVEDANTIVPQAGNALAVQKIPLQNDAGSAGFTTTAPTIPIAGGSVSLNNTGGSQAFDIRSPYETVNCIIALQGLFPSRN